MERGTILFIIFIVVICLVLVLMIWSDIKSHKRWKKLPKYEIRKSYDAINDKTKYVVWQYLMHGWKYEIFSSDTFEEAEEVVKRIIENDNEIITNEIISQYYEKHFSE